jgi:acyl-CoA reductase-like NAD-dependent aldehyde dehydrogenase
MLVGGEWVGARSGATRPLVDPGTEEVVAELPFGDAEDARAALDAASDAFPAWARKTAYERAAVLERAADLIAARTDAYARRTSEESGKPLAQAKGEWAGAPAYLRTAADQARHLGGRWIPARAPGRRIDVTYAPLGVVGVITAWNFPVYNVNRSVSSALAAGCTVVVRPSEYTPRSAFDYAQALVDAGVPAGVVNVVHGEPGPMAQAMLADPRCRKLSFTGSTRVGKILLEGSARTVKRLALELGGNAPVLVFPDCDVEAVARAGVTARLRNAGQVCIAPQRVLVHASVVDAFTRATVAAVRREVVGHGLERASTVGPLINAAQRDRVEQIVAASAGMGARVLAGGGRCGARGYFFEPTVLNAVPPDAPALREEIFGPVLPIVPFETEAEALALANDTDYGLAAYVFTRDLTRAMTVSEGLAFGMVGINDWYPVTAEAPFGGMKQSGMGRESGLEGVHEYVDAKTRYFGGIA